MSDTERMTELEKSVAELKQIFKLQMQQHSQFSIGIFEMFQAAEVKSIAILGLIAEIPGIPETPVFQQIKDSNARAIARIDQVDAMIADFKANVFK